MSKFKDQLTRLIIGSLMRGLAFAVIITLTVNYTEAAGKDPVLARTELSAGSSVKLTAKGLSFKATRKETKDGWSLSISGKSSKGPFSLSYRFKGVADYPEDIVIVELDPRNSSPEIMFSAFTGGAHCCSVPVFISEVEPGDWTITSYQMIDGGPPFLEDIDGDGAAEIITIDQTFLYAFDSYAASYSPMRVEQLRDGVIKDVTRSKTGRAQLKTQLNEMEADADNNPDLWRSNGYLSAWVALKSFLGEGKSAWKKMLLLYDRQSDFGTYECADKTLKAFDCPSEKLVMIPFPDALEAHLKARRYWDKEIEKPD